MRLMARGRMSGVDDALVGGAGAVIVSLTRQNEAEINLCRGP